MDHEKPKCIDTTFNVNSDAQGKDPDKYSPTLKDYHRKLWSMELPCGVGRFDLAPEPNAYLVHRSSNGVFFMASDAITTRLKKRARRIIKNIPPEDLPAWPGYTIGSSIVFPGNKVDGKMTLNGARGFNSKIADRFDLTLESIRRYYDGRQEWSPLEDVLAAQGLDLRDHVEQRTRSHVAVLTEEQTKRNWQVPALPARRPR